jgi:hypothetical protein
MRRPAATLGAIATGLLLVAPVFASHVAPEVVSGAESCGPLAPGTVELIAEVPAGLAGSLTDDAFSADISLDGAATDGSISFSNATLPVRAAFVAGVDGGNLYNYAEPVTEDDGLVAPDGQPISGLSLCYVAEGTVGESAAPSTGGGEAPAASGVPATDTVAPAATGGPGGAAVAVTLILGSLAGFVAMRRFTQSRQTR